MFWVLLDVVRLAFQLRIHVALVGKTSSSGNNWRSSGSGASSHTGLTMPLGDDRNPQRMFQWRDALVSEAIGAYAEIACIGPEERRLRRRGTAAPLNSQPSACRAPDRPDSEACPAGDPAPTMTPEGQTNSDASVEDSWWLVDAAPFRPRPCLPARIASG